MSRLTKLGRSLKLKYLYLLRSKGAPSIIARSFAIGLFIEFITLPTMGIAFLLLYPLIKLFRGMFGIALIAFAMGKTMVPIFWVLDYKVGSFLLNKRASVDHPLPRSDNPLFSFEAIKENPAVLLEVVSDKGLIFLTGSTVNGIIIASLCYGLVYWSLGAYRKRKEQRKEHRKELRRLDKQTPHALPRVVE